MPRGDAVRPYGQKATPGAMQPDDLKDSYIQIAINQVTDPILKHNVVDWPYDSIEK